MSTEPEVKNASGGRLFQVEDTAKMRENMATLGQMKEVSRLEPWRGIVMTMREERPDLEGLREPGSLYIVCTVMGGH